MMTKLWPYAIAFVVPLVLTLILTPIVREINRRIGLVDKPDPRRINKIPIPRGGGLAIVIGVLIPFWLMICFRVVSFPMANHGIHIGRMMLLSAGIALLGLADDKFSLKPIMKLLGQLVIAFLAWFWVHIGFHEIWPSLPPVVDCCLTVFWLTGAMNAFNLIDGLDGLASGLALIAMMGMAGSLVLTAKADMTFFHLAMAGGLLGFLRYNYNPASVFLGDCGSMFIGFIVASLPLCLETQNSFMVSVGVPLLAMGVPIFDTSLAILRRTIRRFLSIREKNGDAGNGSNKVMNADADHLHHRILRDSGFNQRKAAWVLYTMAAAMVAVGLIGMSMQSRAAGVWLLAFTVAVVVIFRDIERVEFSDAARLMSDIAHDGDIGSRRLLARVAVPFLLVMDVILLAVVSLFCQWVTNDVPSMSVLRKTIPLRVGSVFFFLVVFRTYSTVWSRALSSNYIQLALACLFGTIVSSVLIFYFVPEFPGKIKAVSSMYVLASFLALSSLRMLRAVIRDTYYSIDAKMQRNHKDVSRILVYGGGIRYRAFRRVLVRSTFHSHRVIVGILDDNILLRGHYIGRNRVLGTINQAAEIINRVNADTVMIACDLSESKRKVVMGLLATTGVKVREFSFVEREI